MLLAPTFAAADTEAFIAPSDPHSPTPESGRQAGTCSSEPEPNAAAGAFCSVKSPPSQFDETAAGHPNFGFTQFIVRNTPPGKRPIGQLKNVRVDLPVGLSVNPGATPRGPEATFVANSSSCPPESAVGTSIVASAAPLAHLQEGPHQDRLRAGPRRPVGKFTLIMKGGKHGLLVNSRNLCGHKNVSFLNFRAQNGKKLKKKRLPLRVPACHAKRSGNTPKKG